MFDPENPYSEILISSVKVHNLGSGTHARYLRLDCPWCPESVGKTDEKGHLYFYLDTSVARCMRCGAWGSAKRLFEKLSLNLPTSFGIPASDFTVRFRDRIQERYAAVEHFGRHSQNGLFDQAPEISLPPTSLPLQQLSDQIAGHRRVLDRVREWKLDLSTVYSLGWHWNVDFDGFIFPVFHQGSVIYWSSRSFDGKVRFSAPGQFAQFGILGHIDHPLQYATDAIYLVEGPKDSAALIQEGIWGVHLFGHRPNLAQIQRLTSFSHSKVLLFDSDVAEETRGLSQKHRWKALYLPSGDPADHAGNLREIINQFQATQSSDHLSTHSARIRQKLGNPQIHRKKS